MAEVLLGFGGNLGDVPATIEAACDHLARGGVAIATRSRLYRTTPWGPVAQPDFVNACALARTALAPHDLLALTQAAERELGRQPGARWGPRAIDIDLLAYDDLALDTPDLVVPHPRLTERAFVLVPLAEIAPAWTVGAKPVRDWAADADRSTVTLITDR